MKQTDITIVLPCAGEGKRLGLSSPKELYEIFPGTRLIDFSLKHILAAANSSVNSSWNTRKCGSSKDDLEHKNIRISVAVVIQPWKLEVVAYVKKSLGEIPVKTILFDDNFQEWPGSVFSAAGAFSRNNMVLLPDSFLSFASATREPSTTDLHGKTLVDLMLESLMNRAVAFGCIHCCRPDLLTRLGAVRVEEGNVTVFQDKPVLNDSIGDFNGFWGCYGFRGEMGRTLYDFLIDSVHHRSQSFEKQPFFPPAAIDIKTYYDLGTWDNIGRFLEETEPGG
jgi:hypothetical protein